MTSIYLLTQGEFSFDYRIIGLYSTMELAEKAQFVYPGSQIKPYSVDDALNIPLGMRAWSVAIRNGQSYSTCQINPGPTVPSEYPFNYLDWGDAYLVHCWAADQKHAQKIALDKYHQHQAQQAGIA